MLTFKAVVTTMLIKEMRISSGLYLGYFVIRKLRWNFIGELGLSLVVWVVECTSQQGVYLYKK